MKYFSFRAILYLVYLFSQLLLKPEETVINTRLQFSDHHSVPWPYHHLDDALFSDIKKLCSLTYHAFVKGLHLDSASDESLCCCSRVF